MVMEMKELGYPCRNQIPAAPERRSFFVVPRPVLRASGTYLAVKRAFDVLVSLLLLLLLLLPMGLIALLVMLDSPGAPIFRQERLGKNGVPFVIYKFRSMGLDAEVDGPQWAEEDDQRCTRVGRVLRRTRLDELPQLVNILRGDMSFVGPRPERACFYELFESYIAGFSHRLLVTPGLTGWAQVNGGYVLRPEEKVRYDMEYIEGQSLRMDLSCLLKTFHVLLTGKGAR